LTRARKENNRRVLQGLGNARLDAAGVESGYLHTV
jgi:hypothetical protein